MISLRGKDKLMQDMFLKFIDSKAIRTHCRSYQFAPSEQAVLIAQSRKRPVEEKLEVLEYLRDNFSEKDFEAEKVGMFGEDELMTFRERLAYYIDGLKKSLDDAFKFASVVLVERAITDLTEINCSVCGDVDEAFASECEQPAKSDEILSYENKYLQGGGSKKTGAKTGGAKSGSTKGGMASLARKIPAEISPERREEIRSMAVKAFKVLGCNGVSRIDFMIDGATDKVYLNEINTIPGSLSFYLWEPVGVPYTKLLDGL